MSVINNVLKDLDNKPSAFIPLEMKVTSPDKPDNESKYKTGFIFLLVILLILVISYFVYFQRSQLPLNETGKMQPESALAVNNPAPALPFGITELTSTDPLAVVEQNIVTSEFTGLQLNETDDFVELTLQLPVGAQSFLKQSSQNRYVFLITNVTRKIIPPVIQDNAWLDRITVHETDAGTELQFNILDNVLIETQLSEKEQGYNWVIRLKKSIPEEENIVAKEAVISTQLEPAKAIISSAPEVSIQSTAEDNRQLTEVDVLPQAALKLQIKPVKSAVSNTDLLQKAQQLIQQRKWQKAQQNLEALVNSNVDKKARIKLLTLFQLQLKSTEMKLLLAKSMLKYPGDDRFLTIDAGLLFAEKNFLTLVERYQNNQSNIEIINLVAASLQTMGQHDKAITFYQRSLKINRQQARNWISLAISQEQEGLFDRALQSYKNARLSGSLNNKLLSFINQRVQQLSRKTE